MTEDKDGPLRGSQCGACDGLGYLPILDVERLMKQATDDRGIPFREQMVACPICSPASRPSEDRDTRKG